MTTKTTQQNRVEKIKKDVDHWVNSEQGRKVIKEAIERTANAVAKMQDARQVSPEILHKPFTV